MRPRITTLALAFALSMPAASQDAQAPEEPGAPAAEANPDAAGTAIEAEAVETIPVQESGPPADAIPAGADATMLDEMVVTAQRRRESLQSTPISIEAFSPEKLEQRGIEGLVNLSGHAPGLTIEPFPTHNATLRIFIRGVGINDAQLTQDPAVGVYLDGVYIARSVGLALDVADLERIEVLRGPQGTLYGRNTTGGAVNLITKRPNPSAFTMAHKLTLSDRKGAMGKSSFNVPLGDALAAKVAVLGSTRDGFVENTGPGGEFGDREELAGRVDLRWAPVWWLTADYGYDRTEMNYFNYMFQAVRRPEADKGQAELFKPFAESQTVYSSERLEALATGAPLERSGTEIDGHALTLTAPFLPGYEVKYSASVRRLTDLEYADLGGGAGSTEYRLDSHAYDGPAADVANGGPTPLVIPTVTQDQVSHELQVTGDVFDGELRFVAGAFHFTEHGREDRHRLNHQVSTALQPEQVFGLASQLPAEQAAVVLALAGPRLVNFVDFDWTIDNRATAFFGEATWTPDWDVLADRLHLTAGYRHSGDDREAVKFRISDSYIEGNIEGEGHAELLSSGEMFDDVPAARRFTDDSFSYIAAFDVSPDLNVYAKSSEAYKSGGFNIRDPHISGASEGNTYGFGFVDGFDPEYVQSYEIGAKSEWLGRRLRVNADVFSSRYRDMQINFLIPGTISDTKTENAGRARMRGLEFEATWLPLRQLLLAADYAYLDADVLDVRDAAGNNVAALFPFVSAPAHSFVVAADWTFLEFGWGQLKAYANYNFIDRRNGIVIAEERRGLTAIPAYGLFNLRLAAGGIRFGESRGVLDVALWSRNLADRKYPIMAIDNVPQADRAVVWGEPRSVGLDLIYRYD